MTPDLDALLKIAEDAERSRGTYPVEMYAVTPFAEAFNPTVAQALVRVAMAAAERDKEALDDAEVHPCDFGDIKARRGKLHGTARALSEALSALTATLKGNRSA